MSTGYFEKKPGEKSMMRLIVFIVTIVGLTIALAGTVMLAVVLKSMITGTESAGSAVGQLILLIGGALSVSIGSEGFKALQQRGEAKQSSPQS